MPRPTDTPPASRAPLLAASMIPGPPPVMTVMPLLARAGRQLLGALPVRRVIGASRGRAEDGDRRAQVGQRVEALDELALMRSARQASLSRKLVSA